MNIVIEIFVAFVVFLAPTPPTVTLEVVGLETCLERGEGEYVPLAVAANRCVTL
jgi:hypothetical protein